MSRRTGAQVLVDQLKIHGAETIFCVPGESYLAVLDALYDANSIRLVTCRQEGGAAMMADAYGKLTGEPGLCMVTRGPGATNASAGLHVAMQDSTPLILFIGQVARDTVEREAFQEIDYRRMFGQLAKWVAEIDDPRRIPEFLSRAYYTATSGRPGPVVLALPEDMLTEEVETADAQPYRRVETWPGEAPMARLAELLRAARRPFLLLGGSAWDADAVVAIERFAAANALPVGCVFRRQDRFDNAHPCYAGDVGIGINPKLAQRIKDSDLLIAVGPRLGEMTTGGYTLLDIPTPAQPLVHVHADPEELGRVYQPALAINATPRAFARAAAALPAVARPPWADATAAAHQDYLAFRRPPRSPGEIQMGEIVLWLDEHLPADAIFTNGAGNFATWVHRFRQYRRFGSQLAPTSGSMGYGFPAAVAAKLRHPDRAVICVAGDGDFLMTGQELATAVHHRLGVIVLVVNNGMYGTIRMHQERHHPNRVIGTALHNPDFAALARSYGAHGEVVERTADFPAAFERARAAGGPAILELRLDPEALTIRQSLSEIRAAALAGGH
ncbi:MAG TPA: thiamine pyrophosphate-binding protein [Stellaceae bacterium]|jgi:acetolactate synthase-1/2/3 large subunit|nr:thiamine pyrophosphate-binding protein [Stellaceae bacterium]